MEIEEYIVATDQRLVELALDCDQMAFEYLIDRYRNSLCQLYLQRTHGNAEDVDDLLQETFIKVFANLARYNSQYTFGQWIFTIARNTFIDHVRRKRDEIHLDAVRAEAFSISPISQQPTPEESIIRVQQRSQLDHCMAKMPDSYKELIELRFYREYSYEEIAEELGMPLGTVKTRIHRARERLIKIILSNTDL